jgi:hypothetical protein
MTYVLMFVSSFIVVFLLGLQSRNVVAGRYLAAILTSAGINISQFIFVKFAAAGHMDVLAVTTMGGCSGIAFAIWFYQNVIERKKKTSWPEIITELGKTL